MQESFISNFYFLFWHLYLFFHTLHIILILYIFFTLLTIISFFIYLLCSLLTHLAWKSQNIIFLVISPHYTFFTTLLLLSLLFDFIFYLFVFEVIMSLHFSWFSQFCSFPNSYSPISFLFFILSLTHTHNNC
jgi:hypothetical protein